MRLLTKTNVYFLIALIPLLIATGFFIFSQFSRQIDHRTDTELIATEIEWIKYLQTQAETGRAVAYTTPDFSIYPVEAPITERPAISDVYQFSAETGNKILYRQLTQVVSIYGLHYQLTLKQSLEQREVLVRNVTNMMLLVFAGLCIATLIFNWMISKRLWAPFQNSLSKIRNAELNKLQTVHFEKSDIEEFNDLNTALNDMAGKINREYLILKEFTENAAHEMQTPLAVIQSRLEFLLQSNTISQEQARSINEANESLSKLSKLNKGLLLLARIENNQFEPTTLVNLTGVIEKYVRLFDDLIADKKIETTVRVHQDFLTRMHPFLADSLVSNLIGNAIKYNYQKGRIEILVSESSLSISNTSDRNAIPHGKLFTRFNASGDGEESSNGLGLAIVKSICNGNGLDIRYIGESGLHKFIVEKKRH